jgi:hypothetical protein
MSAPLNDASPTKGMNSPTLDKLAQSCLDDLYAGKLDEDGQRYAAEILGERLRRQGNTLIGYANGQMGK